jgi:imidazole glycerol phosphate synthase glutamine amidotransferase subunit
MASMPENKGPSALETSLPRAAKTGGGELCGIIDYEAANMRSIGAALNLVGLATRIVRGPSDFEGLSRLVLPGVGAFGAAMDVLRGRGLFEPISEWLEKDRPFLGICLGMQLLFEGSEEDPDTPGFGFFAGRARRFSGERVPCMGWMEVEPGRLSRLFDRAKKGWFYFVHSYYTDEGCREASGFAEYGTRYACAVEKGRICAVQFHPEKSADEGMALLRRWREIS